MNEVSTNFINFAKECQTCEQTFERQKKVKPKFDLRLLGRTAGEKLFFSEGEGTSLSHIFNTVTERIDDVPIVSPNE